MKTNVMLGALVCAVLVGCGGSSDSGDSVDPNALLGASNESGLFVVKGSVILDDAQFSDSDTNANPSPANNNDTLDDAQLIANQSVVNGYLGVIGGSVDGVDFYKIQMASGDQMRLTYSGEAPTLSVITYDGVTETVVATGANSGSQQLMASVASKQTFYIRVASTGTTQYVLQTTDVAVSFASRGSRSAKIDDFVPGQLIIKYKDANSPGVASRQKSDENRAQLVSLADISDSTALRRTSHQLTLKQQTLELVEILNQRPDVEYATVNSYYYPTSIPNDEFFGFQWNMHMVNASTAWQYQGANDVVVAVIDTGIAKIADNGGLRDHSDLEGKLIAGFDFIDDIDIANDGDGIDRDPTDTGDTDFNSSFHGTHVAGIIVAKANNGIGVVGVAGASDNIKVMPVRVFGKDQRTTAYALSQAILFAAGELSDADEFVTDRTNLDGSHDFTPRVQIINMSLGGRSSEIVFEAIQKARNAGVVLVASAGNDAKDAFFVYPAAYDGVISVAALNDKGELAGYSNFGASIDVSAPGGTSSSGAGQVLSTYASGRVSIGVAESYEYISGTSMAAPVVSGVIALMKSIDPTLSSSDIYAQIVSGGILDPVSEPATMGYGSINALKAVSQASGAGIVDPAPTLKVTPISVNINYKKNINTVLLFNGGTNTEAGELKIDSILSTSQDASVPENERWLLPIKDDKKTLGILTLFANKAAFADGIYTDTVTIASTENTVMIPVRMEINRELSQVIEPVTVYLRALDENGSVTTDVVASSAVVKGENGGFSYFFGSVPKGSYYLTAGSNTNGNDSICDSGELCSVQGGLGSRIIHVNSGLKANISVSTESIDVL